MRFFIFLLFICVSVQSFSESAFFEKKDSIQHHQLKSIAVLGIYKPSVLKSTTPLQILTQKDMVTRGITSLADAVRQFNGVVLKDYGGIGGLKTISIRGMGAEHTAVCYDGMMASDVQSGQIDLSRFSFDNVSMVSLNIGQSSSIFQAARAFASVGVLEVNTLKPQLSQKKDGLRASVMGGSFGLFNPQVTYDRKINDKNILSATLSWQRADGQYPFTAKNGFTPYSAVRKNSDVNTWHSELNLFSHFSSSDEWNTKLYFWSSRQGLPGNIFLISQYSLERLNLRNFFLQSAYTKNFSTKWRFRSQIKYDNSDTKYMNIRDSYQGLYPDGKRIDHYLQQEIYWSNTVMFSLRHLHFSFAEDLFYDKLNTADNLEAKPEYSPARFTSLSVVALQYRLPRLTVNANLLGTSVNEKVKDGRDNHLYKRITPTVSLSFSPLSALPLLRLRLMYKDIFRIPTITEGYYTQSFNPVRPENTHQLDFGFTWMLLSNTDNTRYLSLTGDAYYNTVKDKIIIQPTAFYAFTTNLGKVDMKGADISLSGGFPITKQVGFQLNASYSYLKAIDVTNPANDYYKNQIFYTPVHSGTISLALTNPWVNFSYTSIFTGTRYYWYENIPDYRLDAYIDQSISLTHTLKLKACTMTLRLAMQNFMNANYQVLNGYPMPGRSFIGGVNIKF